MQVQPQSFLARSVADWWQVRYIVTSGIYSRPVWQAFRLLIVWGRRSRDMALLIRPGFSPSPSAPPLSLKMEYGVMDLLIGRIDLY